MTTGLRIGVDLGGTKIEGVLARPTQDGLEVLGRRRVPTERERGYDAVLETAAQLVLALRGDAGEPDLAVGIGMPGGLTREGLVKNSNSTWMNGTTLAVDLPQALGRPVRFANDANCFALSEATDGAAAGAPTVFGVIIGTGTGGGIVVNGRVLVGRNGVAGEWGHNSLPWPLAGEAPGFACYCGRSGCIETLLSGPGLSRDYATSAGGEATPEEIVAAAIRGDLTASVCLERYEDRFARALASVINVVDPDVIVLGGGLSKIDRLYRTIPPKLSAYVFSDVVATRVVRALHGDSSGVRGAAWLWGTEHAR